MTKQITLEILEPERATITIQPGALIVAGYTGRDESAVREHIEELAAIGIAPPAQVPMLYQLDPALLTSGKSVEIGDGLATGEVEPVFIRHNDRWYLGVGSDLTDRDVEREDVHTSKAVCPKPINGTAVRLPDDVNSGGFDDIWDQIEATSYVDGELYQEGSLKGLRPPSDLIPRVIEASRLRRDYAGDIVVFAGTIPVIDGTFRSGATWEARLALPDGRTLIHKHEFFRRA